MNKGDYVLATKYSDGDPGDHWCVGFFDRMLSYSVKDRYHVVDEYGNPFRGNGFRRALRITPEEGNYLLANKEEIERGRRSLWSILHELRKGN